MATKFFDVDTRPVPAEPALKPEPAAKQARRRRYSHTFSSGRQLKRIINSKGQAKWRRIPDAAIVHYGKQLSHRKKAGTGKANVRARRKMVVTTEEIQMEGINMTEIEEGRTFRANTDRNPKSRTFWKAMKKSAKTSRLKADGKRKAVAEAAEQIDELSTKTIDSYKKKSKAQVKSLTKVSLDADSARLKAVHKGDYEAAKTHYAVDRAASSTIHKRNKGSAILRKREKPAALAHAITMLSTGGGKATAHGSKNDLNARHEIGSHNDKAPGFDVHRAWVGKHNPPKGSHITYTSTGARFHHPDGSTHEVPGGHEILNLYSVVKNKEKKVIRPKLSVVKEDVEPVAETTNAKLRSYHAKAVDAMKDDKNPKADRRAKGVRKASMRLAGLKEEAHPIGGKDLEHMWALHHHAPEGSKVAYTKSHAIVHHPDGSVHHILGGNVHIDDHFKHHPDKHAVHGKAEDMKGSRADNDQYSGDNSPTAKRSKFKVVKEASEGKTLRDKVTLGRRHKLLVQRSVKDSID